MTCAPCCAKRRAICSPMPDPAPVTKAIFLSRRNTGGSLLNTSRSKYVWLDCADSFTDGATIACCPQSFETQAWLDGGMDQTMLVYTTLTDNRITHHKGLIIGVVINSHTEVLMNQPRAMHLRAQIESIGEMGHTQRSSDASLEVPTRADIGRTSRGDVIRRVHVSAIGGFGNIQGDSDHLR